MLECSTINALFSGLAFAGIIWTILLQRNALRLQREDPKLPRDKAVDQNKTLKLQRFENTFFNILNVRNEIIRNLKHRNFEGREVMDEEQKDLFGFLSVENYAKLHSTPLQPQRNVLNKIPQSDLESKELLNDFYRIYYYNRFASNFNHY
ncbi:hypothetical protein [Pedobacter hiemivivus]|uniref:DUF4760 domain-containing protein n=1 Tax=Pedobacter hiemivivus TaxID=2530454 RepID=A0A4R0NGQ3_9SPHI|nr:hypothetical protein [Pedobacter hiemivivus]TCC98452.1 hypothetical protein EZ444_03985 [Pedobacter hiemivivus]